jgi:hypothetical protein
VGAAPDPDWVAQLNIQCELLKKNGKKAKKLQIVAILRDWSKNQARLSPEYPPLSVAVIDIPIWPSEVTEKFIIDKINMHESAKTSLPLCSKAERWAKDDVYAVMKTGQKKAVKLFASEVEAEAVANQTPGCRVVFRPGESTRCELYCSVSKFCDQYKQIKQGDESD